jgi:hypothetical protein
MAWINPGHFLFWALETPRLVSHQKYSSHLIRLSQKLPILWLEARKWYWPCMLSRYGIGNIWNALEAPLITPLKLLIPQSAMEQPSDRNTSCVPVTARFDIFRLLPKESDL